MKKGAIQQPRFHCVVELSLSLLVNFLLLPFLTVNFCAQRSSSDSNFHSNKPDFVCDLLIINCYLFKVISGEILQIVEIYLINTQINTRQTVLVEEKKLWFVFRCHCISALLFTILLLHKDVKV